MTKKLLVPTRLERRQARQMMVARTSSTSSLQQVAFARCDLPIGSLSLKTVSEHNSSCEGSENEQRLQRWIKDQRELEAAWNVVPEIQEKAPPPIPPRPKAFLKRLHHQRQQVATGSASKDGDLVVYPVLPLSPPVTDDLDAVLPPSGPPKPTEDVTVPFAAPLPTSSHLSPHLYAQQQPIRTATPPPPPQHLPLNTFQCLPNLPAPTEPRVPLPQPKPLSTNQAPSLDLTPLPNSPLSKPPIPTTPNLSTYRIFSDATQTFEVHAHFEDFSHGRVRLTKENGVHIAVPLTKLSGKDICWGVWGD